MAQRPPVDSGAPRARLREVLSRVALMTGAAYGPEDIIKRLWMDAGVELTHDAVLILQRELGIAKGSLSSLMEVKARLVGHLSFKDAHEVCMALERDPLEAGVMACRLGAFPAVAAALGVPPRASLARRLEAGKEVWDLSAGVAFPKAIVELAEDLEVSVGDLLRICPELKVGRKASMGLPRAFPGRGNPFQKKTG